MTKYNRVTGKVFGATASATGDNPEIGQFGSAKEGSYIGTSDISTIQALPAWGQGWAGAVTPETNFPPLPEMTGALKVLSQQQCYLLQQGLSEWDSGTIYYKNNFSSKNGKIYISQTDENQGNDPSTDTLNWKEFASGGIPIGTVYPVACTAGYVPDGALPCNGTEYTKAQFNELWNNFLTATSPLLNTCTYEEYANDLTTYGQCAKFAVDTVNNKFRVPFIKDGAVIQQALTDSELGKSYNAGLPNITGTYQSNGGGEGLTSKTGAFKNTTNSAWSFAHTNNPQLATLKVDFDASLSNPIYGNSNTVQPNAVALRYFVQVANGQINQSQMDWSAWATGLQGKANVGLENLSADGKEYASGLSMPDFSRTEEKNLDTRYQAECDGYIYMSGVLNNLIRYNIRLSIDGTFTDFPFPNMGNSVCALGPEFSGQLRKGDFVPCPKGIYYKATTGGSSLTSVYFIKAKGAK